MSVTADELGVEDTLGILAMPGVTVARTSRGLGWTGMYVSVQRETPYRQEFDATANHLVILHLDGPARVTRGRGSAARTKTIGPGGLFVHPAGHDLSVCLSDPLRTVHLYLHDDLIAGVREDCVDLQEEIGTVDPLLEQLLLALDGVVQRGGSSARLYADSLAVAVAAQLVERHSVRGSAAAGRRRTAGLGDRDLATVTELMTTNLQRSLSLADLATSIGLSESQFARAFKARTGQPPHRYLLGLRLEQAQRLLRSSSLSIAEVAVAAGFAHQEHLTRVMRARLGSTPGAFRAALA